MMDTFSPCRPVAFVIDQRHQSLMASLNGLDRVCAVPNDADCLFCSPGQHLDCVDKTVNSLVTAHAIMREHFIDEEKLVDQYLQREGAETHRLDHAEILEGIGCWIEDLGRCHRLLSPKILKGILGNWIQGHLRGFDIPLSNAMNGEAEQRG